MSERAAPTLETLVDHMFDQVFEADQRAELLTWIHDWESANPDVDNAHRITGWIDVAYAFQARNSSAPQVSRPVRMAGWPISAVVQPAPA